MGRGKKEYCPNSFGNAVIFFELLSENEGAFRNQAASK
jgi:hypothetical protein